MEQREIVNDISDLPPAAQRQVVEFIAFLKIRYAGSGKEKQSKREILSGEPFIGIWKDRKDLNGSGTWLRDIRKTEWGETS